MLALGDWACTLGLGGFDSRFELACGVCSRPVGWHCSNPCERIMRLYRMFSHYMYGEVSVKAIESQREGPGVIRGVEPAVTTSPGTRCDLRLLL